jgi:hypothetical protein
MFHQHPHRVIGVLIVAIALGLGIKFFPKLSSSTKGPEKSVTAPSSVQVKTTYDAVKQAVLKVNPEEKKRTLSNESIFSVTVSH